MMIISRESLRKALVVVPVSLFLGLCLGESSPAQEEKTGSAKSGDKGQVVMKYEDQIPMGTHRVEDQSGRKYIIYSTGGPSERSKALRKREREKADKSLEMLPRIVVDTRTGTSTEQAE